MSNVVVATPPQHNVIVGVTHPGLPIVTAPTQSVGVTIPVGKPGPQGEPGKDAQWEAMTAAEFAALPVKDPQTLYVILE